MGEVLVGFDGSESALDALALAALLARAERAELVVACVFHHDRVLSDEVASALQEEAERSAERGVRELSEAGLAVRGMSYPATSPARGLHELVESTGAEALVLGSKGRGPVRRLLPGAVGWRMTHGTSCPVAIAPRGFAEHAPERMTAVGAAYDGSAHSRAGVGAAARLCRGAEARLSILSVASPPPVPPPIQVQTSYDVAAALAAQRERCERGLAELIDSLGPDLDSTGEVLVGSDVAGTLATAAEAQGLDLLVCGSRGFGSAKRVLLGSTSSELARTLPCSLLVVPPPPEQAQPDS